MAGLNQTIMMALSMVVVASMIGARGLGEQVLNGIQTLDVGKGLEAGIGIVILAVVLDRITQGFGKPRTEDPAMADIEIRNVYKIFGHDAKKALAMLEDGLDKADILSRSGCTVGLNDVSLKIGAGKIFVIMGLSGSGKSTLVRHINRLIEPTSGEVLFDGDNILDLGAKALRAFRMRRVSMVFQSFALMPHRTVLQNVVYGQRVRGVSKTMPAKSA